MKSGGFDRDEGSGDWVAGMCCSMGKVPCMRENYEFILSK